MNEIEEILKKFKSCKLLKKNEHFKWMNHYLFTDKGDILFGNLYYLIRCVGFHSLPETTCFTTDGEESEELDAKILTLWGKAFEVIRGQSPLLVAESQVENDEKAFQRISKFIDNDDPLLCHVKNQMVTLNYMDQAEENRCSVRLNWKVDKKDEFYHFFDPKINGNLLKLFSTFSAEQDLRWIFYEDPMPYLITSKNIQVISFSRKEIPHYFEEYKSKPKKGRKK